MPAEETEMPRSSPDGFVGDAAAVLDALRRRTPRVHCITNAVATAFTANVLLAAGAVPSMTISPEEVAGFVSSADALLVNLGTFDTGRRRAVDLALGVAAERRIPWVLDPVFVDRSKPRLDYAVDLAERSPDAVRANAAETAAMLGRQTVGAEHLKRFALDRLTMLAVTGETDVVTDGTRLVTLANGHPLMGRVTAMGCAAGALIGACLAVEEDALVATASALAVIAVAGEIAGETAAGPGSFVPALLDALYRLDATTLAARARLS
jgi:hydroxyethylthiazole kinase